MTRLCLAVLAALVPVARADEPGSLPDALFRYVARPEPDYGWTHVESRATDRGTIHRLNLTSQRWQGIVWQHELIVYEPVQVRHERHMLLFVTGGKIGGRPSDGDQQLGLQLAALCGARVATLHQVPNQPLLGDRVEDDLITETWLKYLDTGDETWPLLFPMVKSAVKAMDALQAAARQHLAVTIDGFVITGASKRGWTSWLTPVADRRVIATAPIVIDVLNFRAQMQHQLDTWGTYSEQIGDYTRKGLVRALHEPESPREARLREMMDPYTYRSLLTLPKLLIVGTNDPYWTVDAMSLYFDDLAGPKSIRQVPNAGHSLDGGRDGALVTLAAFFRHVVTQTPLPTLAWEFHNSPERLRLQWTSDAAPRSARLWQARSATLDFRKAQWEPTDMTAREQSFAAEVLRENGAHAALFGELQFRFEELDFSLTTLVFRR